MDKKKIVFGVFLSIALLILISNVFAITGSIGNARMVLRAEQGDTIEKYVLVKNVNNVALDIELSASGDLEKYIDIKDDKFTLQAGEEKKAYFTIKVAKSGTTETKINVKFTPQEGQGVGLSSTVIIIAKENEGWFEWSDDEKDENDNDKEEGKNETGVSVSTGKVISSDEQNKSFIVLILLTITGIIALIFIILLILVFIKTKKREQKGKIKLKKRVKINE